MKKITLLFVAMIIIFYGCANSSEFKVGEQMKDINNKHIPYISMNALNVYKNNDNYCIVIEEEGVSQKLVEFSAERQSCKVQGLSLIKNQDINKYLNMNICKIKEELGRPHVDIGSGFYIPAYITDDAYLIYFGLENDIVFEVSKCDLLTNNVVSISRK